MKLDSSTAFTLDQFTVFVAVVEQNGFAAAARHLNRAQSAITYAIKGLEDESGVLLFDRSTYRPTLTEAGRSLLPRARRVLMDLQDFNRQAKSINAGVEAALTVVSDVFAPTKPLACALAEVHTQFPTIVVKLIVETPLAATELLRSGQAQLGAISVHASFGTELNSTHWTEHRLVAVCAPSHPLASAAMPIAPADLQGHGQLVWTPSNAAADSPDAGVHALDKWYVTDLNTKRELLVGGVGWGSLPDHIAADDLAAGRLVELNVESWEGSDRMPRYSTAIAWRRDVPLGPAASALLESLRN